MSTKVTMPQLGESVVEGTVVTWLKGEGDQVEEYEALVEISTDKVSTEIPAPASGTILKIYVQEDETVEAGALLCLIGQPDEALEPRGSEEHHSHAASNGNGGDDGGHPARTRITEPQTAQARGARLSPVVARMAAEHQVDLNQIQGTGLGGRITKKDVEAYLQIDKAESGGRATPPSDDLAPWERPGTGDLFKPTDAPPSATDSQPAPSQTAPVSSLTSATSAPTMQAKAPSAPATSTNGLPGELLKLSEMRRAIAKHMVQSKLETSPHVTTVFEADLSNVLAHMAAHKSAYAKQDVKLTLTAYFVQAMVAACEAYPVVNSQWTDEGIFIHHSVNVGLAVAVDDGLIVPVIHNAERLNLFGIAAQVNDLAERARAKRLKPDEVKGGTITLTNHGVSGSLFATPIINQPQAAILGAGIVEKRVKVINDAIAIRPCCYLSLTFDHRIIDGSGGDGWTRTVKDWLENHPSA